MNEVLEVKIGDIKDRLEKILGTVSGNFSIEQQTSRNQDVGAVLLKIYQHRSQSEKDQLLILVIDERLKIGVCEKQILKQGINPLVTKRRYHFDDQTFAPWFKSQLVHKLAA